MARQSDRQSDGIDAIGQDLLLACMSQNLVIKTAALPLELAALVVIYAGEGMPPRGGMPSPA